ncbi:MAG: hypothetical protein M3414_04140 [Pseudomonadota bacterium]|nr:hypothetical protein [Pseudomonadota bacterium]
MFEIIACDQEAMQEFYSRVFGWTYRTVGGFSYIDFPPAPRPLLGGIGQVRAGVPGFRPGHNFYLLVDNLEATIEAAKQADSSVSVLMEPSAADGYRFAMILDPEKNPIGLIETFGQFEPFGHHCQGDNT